MCCESVQQQSCTEDAEDTALRREVQRQAGLRDTEQGVGSGAEQQ